MEERSRDREKCISEVCIRSSIAYPSSSHTRTHTNMGNLYSRPQPRKVLKIDMLQQLFETHPHYFEPREIILDGCNVVYS